MCLVNVDGITIKSTVNAQYCMVIYHTQIHMLACLNIAVWRMQKMDHFFCFNNICIPSIYYSMNLIYPVHSFGRRSAADIGLQEGKFNAGFHILSNNFSHNLHVLEL